MIRAHRSPRAAALLVLRVGRNVEASGGDRPKRLTASSRRLADLNISIVLVPFSCVNGGARVVGMVLIVLRKARAPLLVAAAVYLKQQGVRSCGEPRGCKASGSPPCGHPLNNTEHPRLWQLKSSTAWYHAPCVSSLGCPRCIRHC